MIRFCIYAAVLCLLVVLPACGQGDDWLGCCRHGPAGGGDLSASTTVRAIFLDGDTVPGPTGGTFRPLEAPKLIDVAVGGSEVRRSAADVGAWVAFVVPIVDTTSGAGPFDTLFVRKPDGSLIQVIQQGGALPPETGTVDEFTCVWMCPNGTVIFGCTIASSRVASRFGVFSARLAFSVDITPLIRDQQTDLPGMGTTMVTEILFQTGQVTADFVIPQDHCRLFILLRNEFARTILYTIRDDGAVGQELGAFSVLVTGAAANDIDSSPVIDLGNPITEIQAFGVSRDGLAFAAAVGFLDGETPSEALVGTPTLRNLTVEPFRVLARNDRPTVPDDNPLKPLERFVSGLSTGIPAVDGGAIMETYAGGPILVGEDGSVVWGGKGTPNPQIPPPPTPLVLEDDVVMLTYVANPLLDVRQTQLHATRLDGDFTKIQALLRSGNRAAGSDVAATPDEDPGILNALKLVNQRVDRDGRDAFTRPDDGTEILAPDTTLSPVVSATILEADQTSALYAITRVAASSALDASTSGLAITTPIVFSGDTVLGLPLTGAFDTGQANPKYRGATRDVDLVTVFSDTVSDPPDTLSGLFRGFEGVAPTFDAGTVPPSFTGGASVTPFAIAIEGAPIPNAGLRFGAIGFHSVAGGLSRLDRTRIPATVVFSAAVQGRGFGLFIDELD